MDSILSNPFGMTVIHVNRQKHCVLSGRKVHVRPLRMEDKVALLQLSPSRKKVFLLRAVGLTPNINTERHGYNVVMEKYMLTCMCRDLDY